MLLLLVAGLAVSMQVDWVGCANATGRELAVNATDKGTTRTLAGILKLNESYILQRLSRDKAFIWIKRKITPLEEGCVCKESW